MLIKFSNHKSQHPVFSRYIFYFNNLQLWERQEKTVQGTSPVDVFCNLLLATDKRPVVHSYNGSAVSEPVYGDRKSVEEILQRVAMLVKRHWYVLDPSLRGPNKDVQAKAAEHADFYEWLPWKHSSYESVEQVVKKHSTKLAPPPFCLILKKEFLDKNYDESLPGQNVLYSPMQIPQEFFFHRMYVNMSTHFQARTALHSMLKA